MHTAAIFVQGYKRKETNFLILAVDPEKNYQNVTKTLGKAV